MLWCDRSGDPFSGCGNKLDRIGGRDMFEHDFQVREPIADGLEDSFYENTLTIENIYCWLRHLTVDKQRQTTVLHSFQGSVTFLYRGDALVRVGCRPRRVILDGVHVATVPGPDYFFRGCVVGQVQRHQWLELRDTSRGIGESVQYSGPIRQRRLCRRLPADRGSASRWRARSAPPCEPARPPS